MKYLIVVLLIFTGFYVKAQQTYAINGTVSDESGKAIARATIFITGSKLVTITNDAGKFSFNNIQPGTYELAVKMLGFTPDVQDIKVKNNDINISVTLKQSSITLNTVVINGAPDPNREKYLDRFLENFLGQTVNAQQCKLLNPDVLHFHFHRSSNTLQATADDFLIVENKALGYKIRYLLTGFEVTDAVCTIAGSSYFEEMKGTEKQQKKWEENRRIAYLSSSRHFFKAVMDNTVKEDGFTVYEVIKDPSVLRKLNDTAILDVITFYPMGLPDFVPRNKSNMLYAIKIANVDGLFDADQKNFKTLKHDTARMGLFVLYTRVDQSPLFYKTGNPIDLSIKSPLFTPKQLNNMQISHITPMMDSVTIDRNSEWPQKGFDYFGYWSWLRIADLTPLDYFVDPMEEKKK